MSYRDIPEGKVLAWIKEQYLGKLVTDSRSPAGNWLGFTLTHIANGEAAFTVVVKPEMANPFGNIHGGMMSFVIDEVIGWAVVSLDKEQHYTTISLNVDFLYGIKEGEQLIASAQVIRAGKKILHVASEVKDTQGRILARGSANLIATGMEFKH
jgi:acyl-coenzyme A thioesterase 13